MSADEVEIELVLAGLRSGDFSVTNHALQRMEERFIDYSDIQCAAGDHDDAWMEGNKVHVVGPDRYGGSIEIVAAYEGRALVITVIGE